MKHVPLEQPHELSSGDDDRRGLNRTSRAYQLSVAKYSVVAFESHPLRSDCGRAKLVRDVVDHVQASFVSHGLQLVCDYT